MGALQLLSVCVCVCVCVCFFFFLIYVSTQELFLHCCASCGDVASVISITISVIEKALRLFYITRLRQNATFDLFGVSQKKKKKKIADYDSFRRQFQKKQTV